MKQRLKTNGVLIFIALVVLLLMPQIFFRAHITNWSDDFIEIMGFISILLGFLWRLSARGYKAERSKQGASLIKTGPYSIQRNPMYFGIALIGFGVVLILFNFWALVLFFVFFIGRYIMLIFQEEKKLILQFKDEYKAYMESTPRFLPGMNTIIRKEIRDVLPLKISWLRKEIGSFSMTIIGIIIVEWWTDVRLEGFDKFVPELAAFLFALAGFFLFVGYLRLERVK
ncbi:MAG: isoprenylcysteine carboxylmethyltransferase family protein [Candidatus Omnitrophica bacterium]|nr:isoprenylcysteine carboxylmethyltransferase family protein [Candidatus Omnitrophota bacterium]HOX54072.1 isoprenylcysteine carboxylmethyltransferase family protein [Candidatus Omnitrophota bacterium]